MQTITQTQIKAYERCRRLYYLKYIRKLAWPVEKIRHPETQHGADFHLLVRQLILGFPRESLLIPEGNDTIGQWVDRFCTADPLGNCDLVWAEKETTSLYADILWLGKFDALTFREDKLTVFDWKTTGRPPDAAAYRNDPQTRLYRFLAKTCGPRLLGAGLHEMPAENIEMVYWFPEYPDRTVSLPYSEAAYRDDLDYLRLRAREMSLSPETDYPETERVRICRYCDYYAYCFPGKTDPLPETEDPAEDLLPDDALWQESLFSFLSDDEDREETSY